jgi:predicted dehydrogenase
MGRAHVGIYAKNPRAKLVAFCDVDPKKASGDWGQGGGNLESGGLGIDPKTLRSHPTLEELCADPEVDLVDICLPTYLHAEATLKALASGKHVMCEKPLTMQVKDAEKIAAAAKKAKGFMMPAHCMRFWPEWAWLKEAVTSKRYGKVVSGVFRRYGSTPRWSWNQWILQPKLSGSALFDLHIHDIDFVRYVFGDPVAVFAAGNGGKATKGGIDQVMATYLFKDPKLMVAAEGGWNADPSYGFTMRYTVVFEKATVDFDLGRQGKTLLLHTTDAKEPEVITTATTNGWEGEVDYFLTCIEEKRRPTVTNAADAVGSVKLANAELKSVLTRKIVKL